VRPPGCFGRRDTVRWSFLPRPTLFLRAKMSFSPCHMRLQPPVIRWPMSGYQQHTLG
jgi:hypothetical protein